MCVQHFKQFPQRQTKLNHTAIINELQFSCTMFPRMSFSELVFHLFTDSEQHTPSNSHRHKSPLIHSPQASNISAHDLAALIMLETNEQKVQLLHPHLLM